MPSVLFQLPKKPLVDTNVLFEFLLWRFSVATQIPIPVGLLEHLPSDELKEALGWYLDKAKPIQTSPHVISEIHGLLQSRAGWSGTRLSAFWQFAQAELSRLRLEEGLAKVVEMEGTALQDLGPTDTSILELATRTDSVVVTEDGALRGRLMRKEIRVQNCYEIFSLWQKRNI